MTLKTVTGYKGSIERISFVLDEILKVLPDLKDADLTCDGGRAWGKGVYISDGLFTIRIYTFIGAYEFDHINGLREYKPNYFNEQIISAKKAIKGENNHFTIEQAKSFLEYNR